MKQVKFKLNVFIILNSIIFPVYAHGPDWAYYVMYVVLFLGFIGAIWVTWKTIIHIIIPLLKNGFNK